MTGSGRPPVPAFRPATEADVDALTALEKIANEAAIGHLFPGIPFPRDAVAAGWRAEVADPSTTVEVVDAEAGLMCFVCFDARRLRHLAVHPDYWGRGLARAAVGRAVSRMVGEPVLWCLRDNAPRALRAPRLDADRSHPAQQVPAALRRGRVRPAPRRRDRGV